MSKHLKRKLIPILVLGLLIVSGITFLEIKTTNKANAQITTGGGGPVSTTDLVTGDVVGYAWAATTQAPYGGGGWLNFNCKSATATSACTGPAGNWGVKFDTEHAATLGQLTGYAWSNNMGWLEFGSGALSCLLNGNQNSPAYLAKIENISSGINMRIVGWAKFVSAPTDNSTPPFWDGCVSFTHLPRNLTPGLYQTSVNSVTGELSGFAWGSNNEGWISFDCNGCTGQVILSNPIGVNFWADDTYVVSGGGTNLHWQTLGNVPGCRTYTNSSNYAHWRSASQPPRITTTFGNLPASSALYPTGWPINGITQDTTYTLICQDQFNANLPPQTVTVYIATPACTDPAATNDVPPGPGIITDNSLCNYGSPTVNLVATTNFPGATMPVGGSGTDFLVNLGWTFTLPSQVAPQYCSGTILAPDGITNLIFSTWTSAQLSYTNNPSFPMDIGPIVAGSQNGDVFTFEITCTDINGLPFSDTATVTMTGTLGAGPTLTLFADRTNLVVGSNDYDVELSWVEGPTDQNALHSCTGRFLSSANFPPTASLPLSGWTNVNPLPSPNTATYTSHQTAFANNFASTASVGTNFTFIITCKDSTNGDADISSRVTINMIAQTFNPSINLSIPSPNANPTSVFREELPFAGFSPVEFAWTLNDVIPDSCVPRSMMYQLANGTATDGPNPDWDGGSFVALGGSPGSHALNITDPGVVKPTIFWIECDPLGGGGTISSNLVCTSIKDFPFPSCPVPNIGNIPTYQEI